MYIHINAQYKCGRSLTKLVAMITIGRFVEWGRDENNLHFYFTFCTLLTFHEDALFGYYWK